jgi:cadmium resistance protein CadD (predicted permease)
VFEQLATRVGLGCLLFLSTNIDDVLLLLLLFGSPALRPAYVLAGQLLGMAALLAVSVLMARLALVVAPAWVGVLGLVPLGLGLVQLVQLIRRSAGDDAPQTFEPAAHSGVLRTLAVALVTVANGGDNIGVYTPVFANAPRGALAVYFLTVLALTLVLCELVRRSMRHPRLGALVQRYAGPITPFVLIALGLYILIDSRVYALLL